MNDSTPCSTPPNSETPRTDAQSNAMLIRTGIPVVGTDFARQLERELNDALKWKGEDPRMLREQIRVADVAYNQLQQQLNAAKAEAEYRKRKSEIFRQQLSAAVRERDGMAQELQKIKEQRMTLLTKIGHAGDKINELTTQNQQLREENNQLHDAEHALRLIEIACTGQDPSEGEGMHPSEVQMHVEQTLKELQTPADFAKQYCKRSVLEKIYNAFNSGTEAEVAAAMDEARAELEKEKPQ